MSQPAEQGQHGHLGAAAAQHLLQQVVRRDKTGYHVADTPAGHGQPGLQLQGQATCMLDLLQG